MRAIRTRLTYANVMSTIAVVLTIGGGTAFALAVTSADIVNGSVSSIDLKNRDVRGIDMAINSVGSEHVRAGSLAASDLSRATRAQLDEVTASGVVLRDADGAGGAGIVPGFAEGTRYHFGTVTRPAVGRYCITSTHGAYRGATSSDIVLVTVEWGSSSTSTIQAFWHRGATTCPTGNIEVRTHNTATGAATNNVSFSLAVLRGPTA